MSIEKTSDEILLHSVADGEATAEEQREAYLRMSQDRDFKARSCEINNQKTLLQLAYADIEPPHQRSHTPPRWLAAAALFLILIGTALLVGVNTLEKPVELTARLADGVSEKTDAGDVGKRFVLLDADGSGQQLADAAREETRIIFQVSRPDMVNAGEVLDQIENVLLQYRKDGKPIRVELVAYGEGLSVLRQRLTAHADRIAEMNKRFSNLVFVACQNTMDRVNREQQFAVNLLPHVVIMPSGVNHVAKRQAEGWAYINL